MLLIVVDDDFSSNFFLQRMERTSIDADPLHSREEMQRIAALEGTVETLPYATKEMMDELNAKGCTPLHWAIWRCFHQQEQAKAEEAKQTIRLLLRSGADPNAAIAATAPPAPPVDAMDEEGAPINKYLFNII